MSKPLRYRIGNQSAEYELSEEYLDWKPIGFENWLHAIQDETGTKIRPQPFSVSLWSPDWTSTTEIIVHQVLSREVFPDHFFREMRAKDWWTFAIISLKEKPGELFITPLH